MLWPLFVAAPLVLAVGLSLLPRLSNRAWLYIIAAIAIFETMVLGNPDAAWEVQHVLALWLLGVLGPWLLSAVFLRVAHYPRRPVSTACGFAVVYFILLAAGLFAGDGLGLIPQ